MIKLSKYFIIISLNLVIFLFIQVNLYVMIFYKDIAVRTLSNKEASVHSVSQRLGHVDIQTTLDHYAHILDEMKERDESITINNYHTK